MNTLKSLQEYGNSVNVNEDKLDIIKSDWANWLIYGRLMCGPFPGLDGINIKTIEDAKENLYNIINDGIDVFVCLQDEIKFGKGHPYFLEYEDYSKTIRDVCREKNITKKILFLYFPIEDQRCPAHNVFVSHISAIAELFMKGHNIYIHCAGGHGRTGVYVSCFLATLYKNKRIDIDYFMGYVQFRHDKRRIKDRKCKQYFVSSPNTKEQRSFVKDFSKFLKF